jgi:serine/threonine protein kinase
MPTTATNTGATNDDAGVRVREILDGAADLPPAERAAYLDRACGGDAGLRREVESLLAALDGNDGFLAESTVDAAPPPGGPEAAVGTRVGPYRLLQVIGEGGFGVVYMAEQERPVRRRVALKVIKVGMDTRQVVARFEAERQALAMMDHPNIARVLDAGATEAGRPYFVMDLVAGVPITDYCDQNRLDTRARLELFAQVCLAVQHAHQKGVIHRDLKPSNVLVGLRDGRPVPKVIDFGIAKATQSRLTERTLFTEFRQMVGTPAYMSPEQAQAGGLDVDTRSDVYSLGVLLYELLTGSTPFDPRQLREAALGEVQRIIREVEPPPPSTRLSALGGPALLEVAGRQRTDGARLGRLVRGELDWVVMRCMEKDRTRRYESAGAVAADVGRYLADEPVQAGPPSRAYRARKFARRYRGPLAAAGAVAAALVLGLVVAAAALVRARAERDAAVLARGAEAEQRAAAERAAGRAVAVNRFVQELIASADAANARQTGGDRLRQVLDAATARVERGVYRGQPAVEAAVRVTLARLYTMAPVTAAAPSPPREREPAGATRPAAPLMSMMAAAAPRERQAAERHLTEAVRLLEGLHGPEHGDVAVAASLRGRVRAAMGDKQGGERLTRAAGAVAARTMAADDPRLAGVQMDLVQLLALKDDMPAAGREAIPYLRTLVAVHTRELREGGGDAAVFGARGEAHGRLGAFAEAEADLRRAVELGESDHWRLYQLACLQLFLGDRGGYERTAEAMWKKYADQASPVWVPERCAKLRLLVERSADEVRAARVRVGAAVAAVPGPGGFGPWFRQSDGLAKYRAGEYEAAVVALAQSGEGLGAENPAGRSACDAVRAMALAKLGRLAAARAALRAADERMATDSPRPGESDLGRGGVVENWLIWRVLRQEADEELRAAEAAADATKAGDL